MGTFWSSLWNSGPVTQEDVRTVAECIVQGESYGLVPESSRQVITGEVLDSKHIGSRLNEWRQPVTEYGNNEYTWTRSIESSPFIGSIGFGRNEWARARNSVDAVLELLMKEIKHHASTLEGLNIERYIRQGSARDGLKVIKPDEFDTLLQYHIEGLSIVPVQVTHDGYVIPEFCYLEVRRRSMTWLEENFPTLYKKGVFSKNASGKVCLNARNLHRSIFESIIDKAVGTIKQTIRSSGQDEFDIRRSINPPSINITLVLNDNTHQYFMPSGRLRGQQHVQEIDVDIVPGLLLRNDQVPDPSNSWTTMDCPVYAVFKWSEETSAMASLFSDSKIVWRVCSSGYEKHTLDIARSDQRQRIIITALRILKTYFTKAKESSQPPPPVTTVLRSYHLKHIAFYVILYLCHLYSHETVEGVSDVLVYFIEILKCSLDHRRLLHFFHSNRLIRHMYPKYPTDGNELRFNLLRGKSEEALRQARLSLDRHLVPHLNLDTSRYVKEIVDKYRTELLRGDCF